MTDRIHVLHVDDDPDFGDLTATFLEQADDRFAVETVTSASAGRERLANGDFDCVVSDYDMPAEDGIEFLESVREDRPDLPFILFTGKGSEEVASDAVSAGVTDYLQKESGSDQYTILANRIRNSVDRTQAQRDRKRHLNAIETAHEGISILDDDGHFIYVNQAYADLYGYDPEEMVGEHWQLTYRDEDVEQIHEEVLPKIQRDTVWHGETIGLRADGSTFVEDHALATTEDGELVCTIRDITDRKERERRIEAVFNNSYTFVGLLEPDGTVLEANDTALSFADVDRDQVVGKPLWETTWFQTSDEAEMVAREAVEQARGGDLYRDEIQVRGAGGEAVIDFTVRPIFDEQGEVTLLVPEGRDITAQKQYVRRLETLIDNLPGMVYRCRNEHGWPMESVRGEVAELTGYEPAELESSAGVYGTEIIHPDDREPVWEAVQMALAERERFELTYRIITKDGATKWVWERGQGVFSTDGDLTALEGFITGIKGEEAIAEALERHNERQQEFATVISHDLKNPLQVANGRLDLARAERDSEHLETIATAHARMERIIDDVLWLAQEGQVIGETTSVDLRAAIEAAWTIVADGTDGADLICETDGEHEWGYIQADEDRLRQLIENLCSNAIEHAGSEVVVRAEPLEDGFAIEDDGPGIPLEERHRVFDSGYSTSADGTGLGLQIVEQVGTAHGWDIQLTDSDTGGARIEIIGMEAGSDQVHPDEV